MDMSVIKLDGVAFVETIVGVAAAVRNVYEVVLTEHVHAYIGHQPIGTHQDGLFMVIPDVVSFARGLSTSTTPFSSFRPSLIAFATIPTGGTNAGDTC